MHRIYINYDLINFALSFIATASELLILWYAFTGRHGLKPKKRILTKEKSIFGRDGRVAQ